MPHFLCIILPWCTPNAASCLILFFTYFIILLFIIIITSTKSLCYFLDDFSLFACCVLASSCSLSKIYGAVRTLIPFAWTYLCFFLAISTTFLMFWEGWGAIASTIRGYWGQELLPLLFPYGKEPLFSFTLTVCHLTNYPTKIKLQIFYFTLYHWPSWHNIQSSYRALEWL